MSKALGEHISDIRSHSNPWLNKANGKLIDTSSGLPILPFGFYQYTITNTWDAVQPETEIGNGMNLVCPYVSSSSPDKQWYTEMDNFLDRCNELGFKVHYDIKAFQMLNNSDVVMQRISEQINRYKNHPAIFGWYLSDEPDGQNIPLSNLQPKYDLIKDLDPYHPVSMVFCSGGAHNYLSALDIIMVDPYPIPNHPASTVIATLRSVANLGKPILFVPQSFGGGENWARTPSRQEERLMTYLGLMYDVAAIQYFSRETLRFPYANSAWQEIQQIAAEVLVLTSAVAGGTRISDINSVTDDNGTIIPNIEVAGWNDRDGSIVILVANKGENTITEDFANFRLELKENVVLSAVSIFEMDAPIRFSAQSSSSFLYDSLRGMETRAYRVQVMSSLPPFVSKNKVDLKVDENLVYNPSYEITVNPSVPDGNYIYVNQIERGSTFFTDSRISKDGYNSLRLTAPKPNTGILLTPYTIPKLSSSQPYRFSIWSRGAEGNEIVTFTFTKNILIPQEAHNSPNTVVDKDSNSVEIHLSTEWQQSVVLMVAGDDIPTACPYGCRRWVNYWLTSSGTAWLDVFSLQEES